MWVTTAMKILDQTLFKKKTRFMGLLVFIYKALVWM